MLRPLASAAIPEREILYRLLRGVAGARLARACTMSGPSREAQELLDKLAELSRLIEGHRATLAMLEHERMQLQTRLRLTGYRAELPKAEG